jgi:hypothetical protein
MPSSHETPGPRAGPRVPTPASERSIYRTGGDGVDTGPDGLGPTPAAGEGASAPSRAARQGPRSRLLALIVLAVVAVVIVVVGVAAGTPTLDPSQRTTDTFKLLPLTTTTTS